MSFDRVFEVFFKHLRTAEKYVGHNLDYEIVILPAKEMKDCAGIAVYSTSTVQLNEYFIENNYEEIIDTTIPHEICHLLQRKLYPNAKQAHGPEWRRLMNNIFGIKSAKTYHKMCIDGLVKSGVIKKRKKYRFIYECVSCKTPYRLTKKIHENIVRNPKRYSCNYCDYGVGSLNFVGSFTFY